MTNDEQKAIDGAIHTIKQSAPLPFQTLPGLENALRAVMAQGLATLRNVLTYNEVEKAKDAHVAAVINAIVQAGGPYPDLGTVAIMDCMFRDGYVCGVNSRSTPHPSTDSESKSTA